MKTARHSSEFAAVAQRHQRVLISIARSYASTADRDDLLQDMLLALWHALPGFEARSSETTFVYRVALNTALAWNRKERKHHRERQDFESAASVLTAPAARDPRLDWIYQQISELDEVNRSLALLMLDGFSYRDMSQILGLTESNVGVKINRIKAALSARLAKEEHDGL